jgi:nicotinamide-nucleotide amidase
METMFAKFGSSMPANNRKQAQLPSGSRPLDNPHGTAPGFIAFASGEQFVACMPGVPREMKPMLCEQVVPFLRERFGARETIVTRIVHTIGLGESEIDRRIEDLFRSCENPKIAVLAHEFRADVKIMAKAPDAAQGEEMIAPLQSEIVRRLEDGVFGYDAETPASAILELLASRHQRLAIAESCTGGRIAAALTSVPGSSQSFVGAVVAYDNSVKRWELDVEAAALQRDGAVSEQVARQMARGARTRLGADVALATTGIAGPDGGTPEKPVGLVIFALDDGTERSRVWTFRLEGDRETVQRRATTTGLNLLWRYAKVQEP